MSWQPMIDQSLLASKQVQKAAIIGHNGSVWATSANFAVSFFFSILFDCFTASS